MSRKCYWSTSIVGSFFLDVLELFCFMYIFFVICFVDLGVSNQVRVIRVESVVWKSSSKVWPTLKVVKKSCWFVLAAVWFCLFCCCLLQRRTSIIIIDCLFVLDTNDSAKMATRSNWKCPTLLLITLILWLNAANCQQSGNEIFDSTCSVYYYIVSSFVYVRPGGNNSRKRDTCSKVVLKNGKIKLRSGGRVVKYSCNRDYVLVGESTSTCLLGEWTSETPVCASKSVVSFSWTDMFYST